MLYGIPLLPKLRSYFILVIAKQQLHATVSWQHFWLWIETCLDLIVNLANMLHCVLKQIWVIYLSPNSNQDTYSWMVWAYCDMHLSGHGCWNYLFTVKPGHGNSNRCSNILTGCQSQFSMSHNKVAPIFWWSRSVINAHMKISFFICSGSKSDQSRFQG